MDDLRAVLDAVGSKKAAVLTMSEGVGMSTVFAATFPERVTGLMLVSAFAKREWSPDYPWAPTPEERKLFLDAIEHGWGGPIGIDDIAPSLAHDPAFRNWWATYQRRSASPSAALALGRMNTLIDCRRFLPMIKAPTLVMHRRGDRDAKIEEGRWIAEQIPTARFIELPGDEEDILAPVQNFLENLPR